MHAHKQGQGFLSCHNICLIAVRNYGSYRYEQKIATMHDNRKICFGSLELQAVYYFCTHLENKWVSDIKFD